MDGIRDCSLQGLGFQIGTDSIGQGLVLRKRRKKELADIAFAECNVKKLDKITDYRL